MPRNGSGQYNPLTNTWNPPVTGVLATGADFQAQLNDISAAITQSVSKDGQTPMTANLPMGNNSIVGIASGTQTSPSISANGDTNTGLYFPAADTVAIATGGVKRVEVDASGNVGVGVTPSAWGSGFKAFDFGPGSALVNTGSTTTTWLTSNAYNNGTNFIYKNTAQASYYAQTAGTHQWYTAPSGTAGNAITFTQAMTLDASGNLGVGTTSPSSIGGSITTVDVSGAAGGGVQFQRTSAATTSGYIVALSGEFRVATADTNPLTLFTNNTERARITSDGNLLVGTTSMIDGRVSINANTGNSACIGTSNNGLTTYYPALFYHSGVLRGLITTNNTGTTYTTSSDYRLKENIQPMVGALAKVAQLKPCTYKWKVDGSDGQGFIAHELQTVIPDCVTGEKDAIDAEGNPKYQGIDTSFLVATLTAALQEAHGLIKDLQSRVDALEAK